MAIEGAGTGRTKRKQEIQVKKKMEASWEKLKDRSEKL